MLFRSFVFDFHQRGTRGPDSSPTPTNATISDFQSGHDVIEIYGAPNGTDFFDVQISQRGPDTVVVIGDDQIRLTGVHQVTASDFLFDV